MNQLNLFPKTAIKEEQKRTAKERANRIAAYKKMYAEITWQQLLMKILIALKVPLTSAKHQILTSVNTYFSTRPFPWFRVALILLFAYVFFKKDMQFNVNMGAPPAILSEEEDNHSSSKLTMSSFAQTANYSDKKVGTVNLKEADVAAYIKRFTKIAIVEMNKFNVPASIKMGQAILASHAGKNNLAIQLNNHFATTCNGGTNCEEFRVGSQTAKVKSYQSAWESWRAHSQLLSSEPYAHLKKYGKQYKSWATGLEQAGYGNANNYSQQLIKIIETYQLNKLDELSENL